MTEDEIRAVVGPARTALGGQVLIGEDKIAWLLAPPEVRPILSDIIEWHAVRESAWSPSLPDELRPARLPLHVYLAADGAYVDAGRAHLGSWNNFEARLTLDQPMTYETWLAIGGHVGFNATLDEARALLAKGTGDLWAESYHHLTLTITVNPQRACVMLMESDGYTIWTLDPSAGEEPEWFEDPGLEFPRSQTLSHADALEVVAAYLRDGTKSDRVSWSQ